MNVTSIALLIVLAQFTVSEFVWSNFTDCFYPEVSYAKIELICDTHNYNGEYPKDSCYSLLYKNGVWNLEYTFKVTTIRLGSCHMNYWDFVRIPNQEYPQFTYAFRNLDEIDMSSIGLDQHHFPAIPSNFFVVKLNVSHNNITGFNEKTAINLTLLREIDFSYNQIETLSDLDNISLELVIVNFRANNIHYVEWNTFRKLKELKSVDLSYNFIRVLPDNIFRRNKKLQMLNLENSQITRFWCTHCFRNLIHLNVAQNFIAQTRELIEQLGTKVEVLELSSNYLPVAHFSLFEKCRNLYSLNLSNTHLREIYTDSLSTEWNLRTLDLSNNHLTEIEFKSRGTFNKVKILYLNGNNLTDVNEVQVENLPKLELLNISNNTFSCTYLKVFLRDRKYYKFIDNPLVQKDIKCTVCRNETIETAITESSAKIIQDAEDIINSN